MDHPTILVLANYLTAYVIRLPINYEPNYYSALQPIVICWFSLLESICTFTFFSVKMKKSRNVRILIVIIMTIITYT